MFLVPSSARLVLCVCLTWSVISACAEAQGLPADDVLSIPEGARVKPPLEKTFPGEIGLKGILVGRGGKRVSAMLEIEGSLLIIGLGETRPIPGMTRSYIEFDSFNAERGLHLLFPESFESFDLGL